MRAGVGEVPVSEAAGRPVLMLKWKEEKQRRGTSWVERSGSVASRPYVIVLLVVSEQLPSCSQRGGAFRLPGTLKSQ